LRLKRALNAAQERATRTLRLPIENARRLSFMLSSLVAGPIESTDQIQESPKGKTSMTTRTTAKSFSAIIAFAILLTISTAYSASARTPTAAASQDSSVHTIKEAGLQFEVPKGWKVEEQENGNVVVSFEDGAASATFVIEDNYQDVVKGMKSGLKEKLTEMKSDGEPKQTTHNGMTHIEEAGSGLLNGVKVTWSIDVLKATKNVTILTFGIDAILDSHGAEYGKFVNSIKKI